MKRKIYICLKVSLAAIFAMASGVEAQVRDLREKKDLGRLSPHHVVRIRVQP